MSELPVDYSTLDDATLVVLIMHAHASALSELYQRHHRLVFSLALNSVGDYPTAEEITLDVFTRVWQKAATYRADQAKVTTWLVSITRNCAIDLLRQRQSRLERETNWLEASPQFMADPAEVVELTLERERVFAAIAQLSADQKQALTLAYFKGYTHHQIAQALVQPVGTIKTRIRSAMQKLRQILQDDVGIETQ